MSSTLEDRLAAHVNREGGQQAWRPLLLRLGEPEGEAALHRLLDEGRVWAIHDTLPGQLEDLAQVRHPQLKGPALAEVARRLRGDGPPRAYGVWAFYPWSGRLVHVLPPDEFRELRADRNRNKITRQEQARLRSLCIGVVGLSVGQATALTLAMEGVGGRLRLADFDTLALSNLNRLRAGVHELGVPKVHITAREIFELDPYADLELYPHGITAENVDAFLTQPTRLDLVVEECDDLQVKVLLRERARAHRIPVIMETSDRGMLDVERFDLEPDRPLLHGLVGDIEARQLEGLTTYQKVPTVLRIIGAEATSRRMAASMIDVTTSIASWPQLASAVALGGAVVTDTARRIALGQLHASGRHYVDLEEIIHDGAPSRAQVVPPYVVDVVPRPAPAPAIVRAATAALDDAQVRALVQHGALAPSGGNCQPWRFVYADGWLRCIHDVERSRTMLDFQHRASYMAFGAVAENIELAAAGMGLATELEAFPRPDDPTEVCRMRFHVAPEPRVSPLLEQVARRVTNRRLGERQPLPAGAAEALCHAAEERGGRLQLVTDAAGLDELGAIIGRGERLRMLSRAMHADMMREIRWSTEDAERTRDGLELATLELTPTDLAVMRLLSSWPLMETTAALGGGDGLERPSHKAIAAASAVGLVTAPGSSPTDCFASGRAVQRVWLTATALGLGFQPMSALLYVFARLAHGAEGLSAAEVEELRALRRRLDAVIEREDGRVEALMFRLAVAGPPTARALRRDVSEILIIHR